jgi:ABC-type nitrate/sulfonate/bicarbonate transport system substrate-binding protein
MNKNVLRIGYLSDFCSLPLIVGINQGCFSKIGLPIIASPEIGWSALMHRLVEGDIACASVPIMLPLRIQNRSYYSPECFQARRVVARQGFSIIASRSFINQVKKKTLSTEIKVGVAGDFTPCFGILKRWLKRTGRDAWVDRLQKINLSVCQFEANLDEGLIDIYCAVEPWGLTACRQGIGEIIASGSQLCESLPTRVLIVNKEIIKDYEQFDRSVSVELLKAAQWCYDKVNLKDIIKIGENEGWDLDEQYYERFFSYDINGLNGTRESPAISYPLMGSDSLITIEDVRDVINIAKTETALNSKERSSELLERAITIFGYELEQSE